MDGPHGKRREHPMIPLLPSASRFPPLDSALTEPNGLLAAGGDLSPERLLAAYRSGIFPWYAEREPILWWSPDPRMVLFPAEFVISRSLAKTLRNASYEVRVDSAFGRVTAACAAPRQGSSGTWICAEMQEAYFRLHELGYAHCVETWIGGQLAGGLYGVAIGGVFYGESMFSLARDASKIALAHLCRHLEQQGFAVIDCQMNTAHLASLGAREIRRSAFAALLANFTNQAESAYHLPGRWPDAALNGLFRMTP